MHLKVHIPVQGEGDDAWDEVRIENEKFLDGPASTNLCVAKEARDDPIPLQQRAEGASQYVVGDDVHDRAQLAAFGTAAHTIDMFESADVLGTPVRWRGDWGRLELWFPLRGRSTSPAYDPRTGRLELPWYANDAGGVHCGRSRDVVAHETAHAILDGLAPDLADATTPQSLGIHEGLADTVAFVSGLQSKTLRKRVANSMGDQVDDAQAVLARFARIAESYASALHGRSWLRSLSNARGLPGCTPAFEPITDGERSKPHALGEVLSGIMFDFAPRLYGWYLRGNEPKHCQKALQTVADQFKRLVLRPLDYLPPGDLTFGDFLQTVLASDLAVHPYHVDNEMHRLLTMSLSERGAGFEEVPSPWRGVRVSRIQPGDDPNEIGQRLLKRSGLRDFLQAPDGEPEVTVRRVCKRVTQVIDDGAMPKVFQTVRIPEHIVNVRWIVREDGPEGATGLRVGATVVLDELGWVRLALRARPEPHHGDRCEWIENALSAGWVSNDPNAAIVRERTADGTILYRGTTRSLHLV